MSFKKGLFKNILVSGTYTYLAQAISFGSSVIVSRLLSPESYGLVGLITVFTGFISVFSEGGISFALIRSDHGRTYQRVLANLACILGVGVCLLTVLAAYPISKFYQKTELLFPTIVLAFVFLIRSLGLVQGAILAKKLDFSFLGAVTLLSTVLSVGLTITLAYIGAGYWALILSQIGAAILTTGMYEWKVQLGFRFFSRSHIIVAFRHTKSLIGSVIGFNMVNYWSRNADNMIVGKYYGASDLGIYNRAYLLLTLPLGLITGLFNTILFPSLKKLKVEGGDIESEYYFVLRVISCLTLPLLAILIMYPEALVLFLWGKAWNGVAYILPYFALLIYTQALLSTVGHLLIIEGKERAFMISGWIGAVFLVTAIVLGATISMRGIAQFYSFSFIVFVLGFNLFYVYIKVLGFTKSRALSFWLPRIGLSLSFWLAIYFETKEVKKALLAIMVLYSSFECREDLGRILKRIGEKNKWGNFRF